MTEANIREEQGTSEAPECWNLPEKSEYWGCRGEDIPNKRPWWKRGAPEYTKGWRRLFYTKEDAEADAATGSNIWKWDGQPAHQENLAERMFRCRQSGDKGIVVSSYINGAWRVVKQYPAGVPLPLDERPVE